ncbi:hypothetical protein DL546_000063, partial [Coniochaeta pulveracea]
MTTGGLTPARVPTPHPKAPAAASISPEAIVTSGASTTGVTIPGSKLGEIPPPSRTGTPRLNGPSHPGARRGPRAVAADPLSDKATAHLIRRVLCPDQQLDKTKDTPASIDELLPPLTSSNDVDLQLYALIAIILREYVQKWYNKITPDETFVAETVQIIAHCTRALEQRIRKVDLESLLFDEIPDLLGKHVNTYRVAHSSVAQPPVRTDPRGIYHSLWPLPALSPVPHSTTPSTIAEQAENEAAYRQLLVHGALALLLPTEDLENDCLTSLVGQIFSELIIGNAVANKLAEPWMLWEILIIVSNVIRRPTSNSSTRSTAGSSDENSQPTIPVRSFSIHGLFLRILHWCFLAANLVRILAMTMVSSRSIPPRTRYYNTTATGRSHGDKMTRQVATPQVTSPAGSFETQADPVKVPVLAFRLWPAVTSSIQLDLRMPWLCGTLSFLQWMALTGPGRIADVDGLLDRLLSHTIQTKLLDPATLPPLLRTIRGSLFPNNAPGPSTLKPPESEAELRALRRRCARSLLALVPKPLGNIYFRGGPFTPRGSHGVQHSPNPTPPPPSSQYQQSVENKGTAARTAYKTQPGGLNDRSAPAQDSANCPVGTSAA